MTTPVIILGAILASVAFALTVLLLAPSKENQLPGSEDGDISVNTAGSVVTVRKVGHVTSVYIRGGVHDHWEGSEGIVLPMIPTEVTKANEPELYAEYLSPETSAVRKYEIIEELYSKGYTLPYIKGLHEQYKNELRESLSSGEPDAVAANERTPVNLSPK